MTIDGALERWRNGEDAAVVATFSAPDDLLGDRRTLVVVGSDVEAMVVGHALGGATLLRTTPRAERTKLLTSPLGPARIVSSLESLESPVLQHALATEVPAVPWVALRADELSPISALGGWRGPALTRLREASSGGPLLLVYQDRSLAPVGTPATVAEPGSLRLIEYGALGPVEAAAGGLVQGRTAHGEALGHRLGEIGLARRTSELRRLQRRHWRAAASELGAIGVDAFVEHLGPVPGRALLALDPLAAPHDLAVSRGAGLGWSASAAAPSAVEAGDIDRCRAALDAGRAGYLLCVAGSVAGAPAELLADLAAVGALHDLTPCRLSARVADQQRFSRPGIDREPAYASLHAAYTAAMNGWTLQQRAELALTDRRTMDLRPLAAALGVAPSELCDLLVAMDDDGLVTAWVEPLGGSRDWQAAPGPLWDAPAAELAAAVTDLRLGRADQARRVQVVSQTDGCRAQALATALSGELAQECGRCDVCDPSGAGMRAALSDKPIASHAAPAGPKLAGPSLDSLFAGFSERGPVAAPKRRWSDDDVREALASGDATRIAEAVEVGGGPAVAWVRAALDYRSPTGRRGDAAKEIALELVALLQGRAGPKGEGAGGRLEIARKGGPLAGVHRFSRALGAGDDLLEAAAAHEEPAGELSVLLRERRAGRAWQRWLDSASEALQAALDGSAGLPGLVASPAWELALPPESAWSGVAAAVGLAAEGEFEAASEALPAVTQAATAQAVWRAASGLWGALWREAAVWLAAGREPTTPVMRLQARALLGVEPPPELDARVLVRWLTWARGELGPAPERAVPLLSAVGSGDRRAFEALAKLADEAAVASAAVRAGALPSSLLRAALGVAPRADVLGALGTEGEGAAAAWSVLAEGLDAASEAALVEEVASINASVAAVGRRRLAALRARDEERVQIFALAAEERLSEIVPLLGRADASDPAVRAIAQRVAAAQGQYTVPLARALSADGHEEEAWSALRAAHAAGWLEPLLGLLRAQARRHPADARRADWLARATWLAGRGADAERAFGEAAKLQDGPPAQVERELEGVKLALEAGESDRAARWLVRLVRTHRSRSTARGLTMLAWGGVLPREVAEPVLAALQLDGSGLYAAAVRVLQDSIRKG